MDDYQLIVTFGQLKEPMMGDLLAMVQRLAMILSHSKMGGLLKWIAKGKVAMIVQIVY